MSELELEEKIHDYIMKLYNAKYEGLLKVKKGNLEYSLIIGIPSYMIPTTITIDCETDEEFLNFIYAELRSRNYIRLEIYKVLRQNDSREE